MELILDKLPLIIFFLILIVLWFVLRNKATKLDASTGLEPYLKKGQPLVLKFFRNT